MKTLQQWLGDLGLEKYFDRLQEQAIDMDILSELSDADLREFDIPLGDRRRILKAAANLNAPPAKSTPQVFDAERRQLTVMFCDLVGSTALSAQMDAEKLRDLLRAYQDACMHAVEPFGGTVARAYGDGLLIYFGYPIAHDDEAARAVLSGFDIIDAVNQLDSPRSLEVRIGIHTGEVVVGGIRPDDRLDPMGITGDAPNIAARLQEQASPNEIVVSEVTRGLAGDIANFDPLGERTLKGIPKPLMLFQTTARDGVPDIAENSPLPAIGMIGREKDLQLLMAAWQNFKQGKTRAAIITGPPGIGKSQLLSALVRELNTQGVHPLKLRCSSVRVQSPYLPIVELFKRVLKIGPSDPAAERLGKLEGMLDRASLGREESMPLLAPVLSISANDKYPHVDMPDERRIAETIRVIVCCLRALADRGQAVLLFEDLHWMDSSTLAVLSHLIDTDTEHPMFLVGTSRQEFVSPWDNVPTVDTIELTQLDDAAVRYIIRHIARDAPLSEEIVEHIATTTDGVPLFVEELTKSVIEAQSLGELPVDLTTERLAVTSIPASLQDSLLARLDRLGDAKRIAQLGATIGREFSYQLLVSIADMDDTLLRRLIERLTASELVFSKGEAANKRFVFKHALVQGAAYSTLLRTDRQSYHKRIARALSLEADLSGVPQPQLLAHHFTEGGDLQEAIPHWLAAGEHAAERYAIPESISQLKTGLQLISKLDETPERILLELQFHTAIAMPLASAKGYTAPELRATLDRARALCQQLGNPKQLFPALHGMVKFHQAQADHVQTISLGFELLKIAEDADDTSFRVEAHRNLGMSYALSGNFVESVEHCDKALSLYEPDKHRSHANLYAVDPAVVAWSFSSYSKWALGDVDEAAQGVQRAIDYAREIKHPYSEAFALSNAATVYQFRGEAEQTLSCAQQAIEICQRHGFTFWIGWSAVPLGWALYKMGKHEEGLAALGLGLSGYEAAGVLVARPLRHCLKADIILMSGDASKALEIVEEILTMPELERDMYRSEVHRMWGDLLLINQPEKTEVARAAYELALSIARDQQATSFELRCLESIASLDASEQLDHSTVLAT